MLTIKYVLYSDIFNKISGRDMNKCTLFLVFICGIVFSGLVSILRSSLDFNYLLSGQLRPMGIGILPPDADLELMDDGYIAMAQIQTLEDKIQDSPAKVRIDGTITDLEERNSEVEALNSLKAAAELVAAGKNARAMRLLEHAHSLAPWHPNVLITYGEYLEKHREDIVQADHMFLKALTVSPRSSRALNNRRRTQPLVDKIDSEILERIDNKRDELAMIPSLSRALRRIKKEAYFQHIYHTAAIEGNTLTLSQIRMILETGLSVGGKSIIEHNEILGLDSALKYINATLVHRVGRITLKDILEIHRRVLGHVDPIEAGLLRTTQVFVSDHTPPPPSELQLLMEGFISWLNSPEAQNLHPIKYAALAHYKLVFIHPFVDGNGRTARLLMNFLLMQAGFPPVIIRKQDRHQYYSHLQTANEGDTRPFIRFVAHCTEKTIDVYLWAMKDRVPEIEQQESSKPNEINGEQILPEPSQTFASKKVDSNSLPTVTPRSRRAYASPNLDSNNNIHMLPDSWADSENVGHSEDEETVHHPDDIEAHLWLSGREEKFGDGGRFSRVLDETDIYDTMSDIKRLQQYGLSQDEINQQTSFKSSRASHRNV